FWTQLNPSTAETYASCIVGTKFGLFLIAGKATDKKVPILLRYTPTSAAKIQLGWSGIPDEIKKEFPVSVGPERGDRRLVINRPSSGELVITVDTKGGPLSAGPLYVTAWPGKAPPIAVAPCKKVNARGECVRCEWHIADSGKVQGTVLNRTCWGMPPGQ